MSPKEMQSIRDKCAGTAGDGRFELYKVSLKLDNPEARKPNGFPVDLQETEIKEEMEFVRGNVSAH